MRGDGRPRVEEVALDTVVRFETAVLEAVVFQLVGAQRRPDDLAAELPEVCDDPPELAALGRTSGVVGVEPLPTSATSWMKGDHILGHSR